MQKVVHQNWSEEAFVIRQFKNTISWMYATQDVSPNLGGGYCWLLLNNSETVKTVTLEFCSI